MPDLTDRVTLGVREELTLRLPSLASAGYRWQATVEDATVAEATTRLEEASDTGQGPAFAAFELLLLRGRSIGTTRVRCAQRRPWETTAAAAAEQIVTVDVVAVTRNDHLERKDANEH
jgi:predicted secreted protein